MESSKIYEYPWISKNKVYKPSNAFAHGKKYIARVTDGIFHSFSQLPMTYFASAGTARRKASSWWDVMSQMIQCKCTLANKLLSLEARNEPCKAKHMTPSFSDLQCNVHTKPCPGMSQGSGIDFCDRCQRAQPAVAKVSQAFQLAHHPAPNLVCWIPATGGSSQSRRGFSGRTTSWTFGQVKQSWSGQHAQPEPLKSSWRLWLHTESYSLKIQQH